MYFSVNNGLVPTTGPLIASVIPGQTKSGVSLARKTYQTALHTVRMYKISSVVASLAATGIQDLHQNPSRVKIPKIGIGFTGISLLDGSISANIVVGTGAYETTGTAASQTFTITGAPLDTFTNTYVINGVTITTPQATANSVTQQAAADVILINAQSATTRVHAANTAGVITVTAAPGVAGNSITTTSTSSGGDTVTAGGATLAGGTSTTGITVAGNDNSSTSGICTNVAVVGNALFNVDIPFTTDTFPGATVAGGGSSGLGLIPTFPDAVYACGSILTLRIITPVGGTITNLVVSADMEIQPLEPQFPGASVRPAPSVPFGGVAF